MSDGLTERSVDSERTLLDLLAESGGLVTLWDSAGDDIDLWTDPEILTISIGVSRSLRAEEHGTEDARTGILEQMFSEVCTRLGAWYGYSTDEWSMEGRFLIGEELADALARHERTIRAGDMPYILFWVNYFSETYWKRLDHGFFAHCKTLRDDTGVGMIVRTGERPPHVAVFVLSRSSGFA